MDSWISQASTHWEHQRNFIGSSECLLCFLLVGKVLVIPFYHITSFAFFNSFRSTLTFFWPSYYFPSSKVSWKLRQVCQLYKSIWRFLGAKRKGFCWGCSWCQRRESAGNLEIARFFLLSFCLFRVLECFFFRHFFWFYEEWLQLATVGCWKSFFFALDLWFEVCFHDVRNISQEALVIESIFLWCSDGHFLQLSLLLCTHQTCNLACRIHLHALWCSPQWITIQNINVTLVFNSVTPTFDTCKRSLE